MATDEHEQPRESSAVRAGRKSRALRAFTLKGLRGVRSLQDGLLRALGFNVDDRTKLVADMLERGPNDTVSYWLQLGVSIGIATLGLVVGSAAVIIGAMLVAPLMGPIIALAMGLAAGSPFLVLRSASRIVLSVVVSIGGAALITVMLPFHEVNAEIAARTSPTALDLLTAGFCALAGVYASLRPGSDTATTAAGTSIGISLVPPLCASGYGLGTGLWSVAGGAALLFLTNLVAILFVGTLSFVAAGFNRVNAVALERDELSKSRRAIVAAAIARRLAGLFESKAGPALRFIMPLVLLAAVYVPLRRALDEVAWQVRVRAAVHESIAAGEQQGRGDAHTRRSSSGRGARRAARHDPDRRSGEIETRRRNSSGIRRRAADRGARHSRRQSICGSRVHDDGTPRTARAPARGASSELGATAREYARPCALARGSSMARRGGG